MNDLNKKYFKEILWTNEDIQAKCKELAKWVDNEYKDSKNVILIGLLKGCYPFFSDLHKNLTIKVRLDCMRFSSYKGRTTSSGDPRMIMDTSISIEGADVLVVDDIVDTGLTSEKVVKLLKSKDPKSVKFLSFLDKKSGRRNSFQPDAYGFDAPNEFIIGYGLDFNDYFRQLPYIGIFDQKFIDDPELKSK